MQIPIPNFLTESVRSGPAAIDANRYPFPNSPKSMLRKDRKNPRPYLFRGTIEQGPTFSSFVIPKLAEKIEVKKVARKKVFPMSITPLLVSDCPGCGKTKNIYCG